MLKVIRSRTSPIPPSGRTIRRAKTQGNVISIEREDSRARLITTLELMLERARYGEISGLVAAFIDPEGVCTYMLSGAAIDSPAIAATVAGRLKARVDRYIMD